MAKKLNGMLNLSKIPKGQIGTTKNGEKCIFIDIVPNKDGEDKFGNTHSIQLYNKETRETIYLGNLKVYEFGAKSEPKAEPKVVDTESDLPF